MSTYTLPSAPRAEETHKHGITGNCLPELSAFTAIRDGRRQPNSADAIFEPGSAIDRSILGATLRRPDSSLLAVL